MRSISLPLLAFVLLAGCTAATAAAAAQPDTAELVTGSGDGQAPSVSADGRLVAYEAVSPRTGRWAVYLRDRHGGTVALTEDGDGESRRPSLSPDGRYVAFDTTASDLSGAPADELRRPGDPVVVVCDLDDGPSEMHCLRVGDPAGGREVQGDTAPSLAGGAVTVAWTREYAGLWETMVTELGRDENGDLTELGAAIPLTPAEPDVPYVLGTGEPARVSADGTTVVFPGSLCFEYCLPALTGRKLLSLNGQRAQTRIPAVYSATLHPLRMTKVDEDATAPVVSGDGGVVAYVRDGRVVVDGQDGRRAVADGTTPALSADGRYLTYRAPDLVARDLVADRERADAGLPALSAEPVAPSGDGPPAALSADGATVVFDSAARLAAADVDEARDVYARAFAPVLAASGTDFGALPDGTGRTVSITLRHSGFGPLRVSGVDIDTEDADGADFAVYPEETCTGATLYAGDECAVAVRFTATGSGARTAALVVTTSSGPVRVPLRGESVTAALGTVTAAPSSVAFPGARLPLTSSPPVAVTVTNGSPAPVTITGIAPFPGPHAADFTATGCTGRRLAPGERCVVSVVATPRGGGARTSALVITTTDRPGSLVVALTATGETPALVLDPGVSAGGRVVTVTGVNFPPGREVAVSGSALPTGPVLADQTGRFTAALVAVGRTPSGGVTAVVTGTDVTASAPLLVVAGTYQPPGLHGRR
ncbi:choice-of-anchor D domain-containing protein [Actinophytocola glycyrrhizae]|uniref:Choice-of-anchor D domain-containing protein n=1 Tax=Actinophytocola glycyrrhizae TaxID=2044873 RepID=A0ABV9S8T7_9PSEU